MGRPREHGQDTHDALLAAAERLVTDAGPDALSVRAAADATGTTTRAVYTLFGSKDGLVAALAQRTYELLYHRVQQVPEGDPIEDLVTIGLKVFRRFVREHPSLYRIAYQRIVGLSPSPGLTEARQRTYNQLQQRVRRLRHAGLPTDKSIAHATLEVIAMFEGLANAELRGDALGTIPPGEEERAWREGLTALLHGMIAPTPSTQP